MSNHLTGGKCLREEGVNDVREAGVGAYYKAEQTEGHEEGVAGQHSVETAARLEAVPGRGGLYYCWKGDAQRREAQRPEQRDEQLQVRNSHGQQD